jgi:hypothetical protein
LLLARGSTPCTQSDRTGTAGAIGAGLFGCFRLLGLSQSAKKVAASSFRITYLYSLAQDVTFVAVVELNKQSVLSQDDDEVQFVAS